MMKLTFLNDQGDFTLQHAGSCPAVYFPLMNAAGMMSSVTPNLAGDCKSGQERYLLAPASAETLHESRATRNFWVLAQDDLPWSVTGQSARQQSLRGTPQEEDCTLTAGLLWQKVTRRSARGLTAEVLSFVPAGTLQAEIMQVTLRNDSEAPMTLIPVAAIPLYGRSADNIRDHRHVTSLLHRMRVDPYGLTLTQTMTFDERGHQPGDCTYRAWASDGAGHGPVGCIPRVSDYVGGGSYDWPDALLHPDDAAWLPADSAAQGGEAVAALRFAQITLAPGETAQYQVCLSIQDDPTPYLTPGAVSAALKETKAWWQAASGIRVQTGLPGFGPWVAWVGAQPTMRRICGCSFLPHHDYGRGGRGWRDLWQDSLALLLHSPDGIGQDLADYCQGVRMDGTNATIIGTKKGEFKADRNGIPRVWMDHGFWPILTVAQYLDETGDASLLLTERPYFCDTLAFRGEGPQRPTPDASHTGTVLEHLLVQAVTAFYDVGDHGHIRLRGADWNDALDMARDKGESVAFTAAYALALTQLSAMVRPLTAPVAVPAPLAELLQTPYGDPAAMRAALMAYCHSASTDTAKAALPPADLADRLDAMAEQIRRHIRETEWVTDGAGHRWLNSYYDNKGRQVEGLRNGQVRMMLTGQVFFLMAGVVTGQDALDLASAAAHYLRHDKRGGWCLNTDFQEVCMDLGRMFGFAYGHKENGAVFCHMAVMYANALFTAGLPADGWQVLHQLFRQCMDFPVSRSLPGIPEYFDDRGVGMYPYLTGAASWLMLTLRTRLFGIRGQRGDLLLEPHLAPEHFDDKGVAAITCPFGGKTITLMVHKGRTDRIASVTLDGQPAACLIPKERIHEGAVIHITLA